jgi:bifunctional non-homologous end joining protein LigD
MRGRINCSRLRDGAAGSPRRRTEAALPEWIRPQLTQLVDAAPEGDQWLHEIKFDGSACTRASIAAR